MLTNRHKARIKVISGHDVLDSELSTIDDLRSIDEVNLKLLKKIAEEDEFLASLYLADLVTERNKHYVSEFITDVIIGNDYSDTWRKNMVITCDYSFEDIVGLSSIDDLAMPFNNILDEIDFSKILFNREDWCDGLTYTGSLCIELTDYDYRTKLDAPLIDINVNDVDVVKTGHEKFIALRWLASYMAKLIWEFIQDNKIVIDNLESLFLRKFPTFQTNKAIDAAILVIRKELSLISEIGIENYNPGFTVSDQEILEIVNQNV